MSLIHFKNVYLRYSEFPLFDHVSLRIAKKEKVAIIGRNGAGKSTLLKLIQGQLQPDSGSIERNHGLITMMPQDIPRDLQETPFEYLSQASATETIADYQVRRVLSQLRLPESTPMSELSGGQIRRCLLGFSLVQEPDILLLDEPTNHLDLESIQWLESFVLKSNLTIIIISHDRHFLESVSNKIIEVDRGNVTEWDGSYSSFLDFKEQELEVEKKQNALFDKRLSEEEIWIRQGIKARRTRNEGRVRALEKMRNQFRERRQQQGTIKLQQHDKLQSGKRVFVAENLSVSIDQQELVTDFSCIIERGEKIGIIGKNGCGKTTLLRCLLGQIPPSSGWVKQGTQLEIGYFDQQRHQLDPDSTVMDSVSAGRSHININGKDKHVISYLQDFLFTPKQAQSKVRSLSGGESNRLLLAKTLATPSNVLILDEPTNDLDIESIELLEEFLVNYSGTLMLISHDRAFLNNVVTSMWAFESMGVVSQYIGGFDDYLRQVKSATTTPNTTAIKSESSEQSLTASKIKISFNERKELKKLPEKIEKIEAQMTTLQAALLDPDLYSPEKKEKLLHLKKELSIKEESVSELYERWEYLMSLDEG